MLALVPLILERVLSERVAWYQRMGFFMFRTAVCMAALICLEQDLVSLQISKCNPHNYAAHFLLCIS